jgi:hypothetical protein
MLNNTNYVNHQDSINQIDLLFFVYYSTKACHKLKKVFHYLPHVWASLDSYIEYAKSNEILYEEDYNVYKVIPPSFKDHNSPPPVIFK